MKKLIIAAAAFAALSAPAFATSLHSAPDYAAIQSEQNGTPTSLKLFEAEMLYDRYND